MRFAGFSRSMPSFPDAATERMAAAVEAITTARAATTYVLLQGGKEVEFGSHGLVDYVDGLRATSFQDGAEYVLSDAGALRRLTDEEQRETGKTWRFEGHGCPYWLGERTETATSLRLQVAEPVESAVESIDGLQLNRYTFRVRTSRGHENAVIARMYEHLHYHQIAKVTYDIWLTGDGELHATREEAIKARWAQNPGSCVKTTTTNWDFGVVTEIAPPEETEILRSANASDPWRHEIRPDFL
jgi:hypothetical protein